MKQDVRLQVFVTKDMDDKLSSLAALMGMRKNEVVRAALGTYLAQWNVSVDMVKELSKGAETLPTV